MKIKKIALLFTVIVAFGSYAIAGKPYSQWNKNDILSYFNQNSIVYEGAYQNKSTNSAIVIGYIGDQNNRINLNFYIQDGVLEKAMITASDLNDYNSIQEKVEAEGFSFISESNDKIGNQFRKYMSDNIEITVVNKKAEWPEFYFIP